MAYFWHHVLQIPNFMHDISDTYFYQWKAFNYI